MLLSFWCFVYSETCPHASYYRTSLGVEIELNLQSFTCCPVELAVRLQRGRETSSYKIRKIACYCVLDEIRLQSTRHVTAWLLASLHANSLSFFIGANSPEGSAMINQIRPLPLRHWPSPWTGEVWKWLANNVIDLVDLSTIGCYA